MSRLHRYSPIISLILFLIAGLVVHHQINTYHWPAIKQAITSMPTAVILRAALLTALGYFFLFLYDLFALAYVQEKLPLRRIMLTSFLSFALSHNVGHALFSGGSMRLRLYSGWGISGKSIAKIVLFCASAYIIGLLSFVVSGYMFSVNRELAAQGMPETALKFSVLAGCAILTLWWGNILFFRKSITFRGMQLVFPDRKLAFLQLATASIDILFAALALYAIIHHFAHVPFITFLFFYVAAQLAGYASQVPGGIGVFEGSFMFLLGEQVSSPHIIATLITYRVIYYLVPLLLSGLLLLAYEGHAKVNLNKN